MRISDWSSDVCSSDLTPAACRFRTLVYFRTLQPSTDVIMTKEYSIAVLPGDGIGREVMDAGLAVLVAVSTKIDRSLDARRHAAGAQHYLESGDALPDATMAACRAADAILTSAIGMPRLRGAHDHRRNSSAASRC